VGKEMNSEYSQSGEKIRLNRYLAQCGIDSRRKADELIRSGNVYVNDLKVAELGTMVVPGVDKVEYRGKEVHPLKTLEYYAMFKPRNVMVTRNDPEGRETVYDIFRKEGIEAGHLNYVGRLDFLSEGLLLFTNDGDLIHAVTHPRYSIKKVYQVKIDSELTQEHIDRLIEGIESEGQVLHAGAVRNVTLPMDDRKQFWYEVDLFEGKNRQIRRMFDVLGIKVGRLRRVRFSCVKIGDMQPGMIRKLTSSEIAGIKATGYKVKGTR
jgi:23S rRNA pseudouridine2605 synthase